MNKATNKPKGTAFVEFKDPAGAAKAAKASADARYVAEGWVTTSYLLRSVKAMAVLCHAHTRAAAPSLPVPGPMHAQLVQAQGSS